MFSCGLKYKSSFNTLVRKIPHCGLKSGLISNNSKSKRIQLLDKEIQSVAFNNAHIVQKRILVLSCASIKTSM